MIVSEGPCCFLEKADNLVEMDKYYCLIVISGHRYIDILTLYRTKTTALEYFIITSLFKHIPNWVCRSPCTVFDPAQTVFDPFLEESK